MVWTEFLKIIYETRCYIDTKKGAAVLCAPPSRDMKIGILGAGVSGLTAARRLQEKGYEVAVYEKENKPGGLARSRIVNGYVYDPHGGHIFNSKNAQIVDWVFSLLPKDNWQFRVRNAKILFGNKYISYPFELSLCELDTDDAVECAYDFLMAQQGPVPDNYRDWLVWNFGNGIAERYMLPYNRKIWAYPLEDMETHWMVGKMPLPTKKAILRSILMKDSSERETGYSTFYYPTYGGIQTMVDKIAEGLDLRLGEPITSIEKKDGRWVVNCEDAFDTVISSIPLPELPGMMDLPGMVQDAIADLKYNSLTTVLCKCPETDISWLYVPEKQFRMHRIGYQSALTPAAAPNGIGCGAFEIIGERFPVDQNIIHQSGIAPEALGLTEVVDSEFSKYAYVIHDRNYRKNTGAIFDYFKTLENFYLLGRFATWNYKNMDMCMQDAFEFADKFT